MTNMHRAGNGRQPHDSHDRHESSEPEVDPSDTGRRYFGERLLQLRESFSERTAANVGSMPIARARPTARALIQCMDEAHYYISPAAYSEIETGSNFPRKADAFLKAVKACLRLSDQDEEDLELRLVHDLLRARLGERANRILRKFGLPRSEWDR